MERTSRVLLFASYLCQLSYAGVSMREFRPLSDPPPLASSARASEIVESELRENGHILFRGSQWATPPELSKLSERLRSRSPLPSTPFTYDLGNIAGRTELAPHVFRVSGAPRHVLVNAHSEASYMPSGVTPLWIAFACPIATNFTGGATPLHRNADILAELRSSNVGESVYQRAKKHGVRYIRNFPSEVAQPELASLWRDRLGYPTLEKTFGEGATASFLALKHPELTVEQTASGVRLSWLGQAMAKHPLSGEHVWFNQLYAMSAFYFDDPGYAGWAASIPLSERPLHAQLGDGSDLTAVEFQVLHEAHEAARRTFEWNADDLLFLDNFAFAHSREAYEGKRSCVLSWGPGVRITSADDKSHASQASQFTAEVPNAEKEPTSTAVSESACATDSSISTANGSTQAEGQSAVSAAEPTLSSLKEDLAIAYRLVAQFGWTETVYQHITARVPGNPRHFLINPYGVAFEEVTAASLMTVDINGTVVDGGMHPRFAGRFNPAGFPIHAAVHESRDDVHVAAHVHTTGLSAVSAHPRAFLPIDQNYYAIHPCPALPFRGLTTDLSYREEIASALRTSNGSKSGESGAAPAPLPSCLLLRNHGVVTLGRTVAEAFSRLFYAVRAADSQVAALSSVGGDVSQLVLPTAEIVETTAKMEAQFNDAEYEGMGVDLRGIGYGELEFDALKRDLVRREEAALSFASQAAC